MEQIQGACPEPGEKMIIMKKIPIYRDFITGNDTHHARRWSYRDGNGRWERNEPTGRYKVARFEVDLEHYQSTFEQTFQKAIRNTSRKSTFNGMVVKLKGPVEEYHDDNLPENLNEMKLAVTGEIEWH